MRPDERRRRRRRPGHECSRDRFFLFFCPPGRKLCQVPAASPLDALAPLHSRQSQRRDPGARHRAAAVLVRSPVAAPPGAIPPAPLKRKKFADAGRLSRENQSRRAPAGGGGEDPRLRTRASEVWLGDARWNRPTRRETKADRETRHPKRRRRRSQTRGETRQVHLYFCINTGKKRRPHSSLFVLVSSRASATRSEPAPRNATARITFTRSRNHLLQCRSPPGTYTYLRSTERTQRL